MWGSLGPRADRLGRQTYLRPSVLKGSPATTVAIIASRKRDTCRDRPLRRRELEHAAGLDDGLGSDEPPQRLRHPGREVALERGEVAPAAADGDKQGQRARFATGEFLEDDALEPVGKKHRWSSLPRMRPGGVQDALPAGKQRRRGPGCVTATAGLVLKRR